MNVPVEYRRLLGGSHVYWYVAVSMAPCWPQIWMNVLHRHANHMDAVTIISTSIHVIVTQGTKVITVMLVSDEPSLNTASCRIFRFSLVKPYTDDKY